MLNEHEARQLAAIQHGLSSDKELRRVLGAPRRRERLWLSFARRFYPGGYVLAAIAYMAAVAGSSQRSTLIAAYFVALVVWLVIQVQILWSKDTAQDLQVGGDE